MSGTSEVLQEYLVRLGYQVDAISLRKFEDGLSSTSKKILGTGAAVATVVAGVEAATAKFAYSMRKAYFDAELAGSSVKNLRAMSFAGKQIGVEGERMEGAIKGMAQALRLNPGLQGLIESFGVKVTGRDTSDVMVDYVKALKQMPEFAGAQYAALFGIDPDTYHQMITHFDELEQKRAKLLNQYKEAGIDPDAAKQVVMQYTGALDELESKMSMLGIAMMTRFMPQFTSFTAVLNSTVDFWIRWARGVESVDKALDGISAKNVWGFMKSLFGGESDNDKKIKEMLKGGGKAAPSTASTGAQKIIDILQRQHGWTHAQAVGIAANLQHESNFNPAAVGDSGKAYGIAQWHPDRQAAFKKFTGKDIRGSTLEEQLAFLNYELRQGNERRAGMQLSAAGTPEAASAAITRHYERPADIEGQTALRAATATRLGASTSPISVQQTNNTTINVAGGDANATGRAVANQQSRVIGDSVRALKGSLQ